MKRLPCLLALNKGRTSNRRFEVVALGNETTIYLYDVIVGTQEEADYWGGVAADTFVQTLAGISASTIHLRINSPGGDVFGARAMEQAMREHPANIIAHVDGVAASAASFLMTAADETEIAPGAFVMIHKAWTMAYGNSDDLKQTASMLDQIDESLVATYAAATGQSPDDLRQWMANETWFGAEDATKRGFATRIAGQEATASNGWDLSVYAHAPTLPEKPASTLAVQIDAAPIAEAMRDVLNEYGLTPTAQAGNDEVTRSEHTRRLALELARH
ncbi:head maturation protease, ClpP-related [Silvimonas sp.]|uniref:head maturation protease, ClpP-related n=1 Tax=Silvimonas sp. TaxID=2650811 RepID=UPI00284C0F74|nr:head maturation protease, ClpP-related [Silvimonas sp.]MDR3427950.1 Clp protease ClpP [Silvimonas sp.]